MLACIALVLYAFGRELPPLVAYELTNGIYAAASAAMLAGFRRYHGISIGVSSMQGFESLQDLMRRADAALYAAKAMGRNRAVSEVDAEV